MRAGLVAVSGTIDKDDVLVYSSLSRSSMRSLRASTMRNLIHLLSDRRFDWEDLLAVSALPGDWRSCAWLDMGSSNVGHIY